MHPKRRQPCLPQTGHFIQGTLDTGTVPTALQLVNTLHLSTGIESNRPQLTVVCISVHRFPYTVQNLLLTCTLGLMGLTKKHFLDS